MLVNDDLTPVQYSDLNDSHVKVVLPEWAKHSDELLSLYAEKLLSRRGFHKSLRIDTLNIEMLENIKERLEQFVSSKGYDPSVHLLYARISKRGYMPYEQGIILEDGRDVAEHSAMISSSLPNERLHIFVPETIRYEAETLARRGVAQSHLFRALNSWNILVSMWHDGRLRLCFEGRAPGS